MISGKARCCSRGAATRASRAWPPAVCAHLGVLRIEPEANWVLSGINHGGNLGADVFYSDTGARLMRWSGCGASLPRHEGTPRVDCHERELQRVRGHATSGVTHT
jgi:broad specificity polyphosphatase/5'/3'-nucleotidase SurE